MNERVMQFRVGVMILATGLIALILIALLGELPSLQDKQTIDIWFERAPGVSADTPVQKSGILIGRVVTHRFVTPNELTVIRYVGKEEKPETKTTGVIVTVSIEKRYIPTRNEICQLNSTLLGDAVLEFVPSREAEGLSGEIDVRHVQLGQVRPQPLELMEAYEKKFNLAIDSVVKTSKSIDATSETVNRMLNMNEYEIHTMLTEANKTLQSVRATFDNANAVIGDQAMQERLATALNRLPETMDTMRQVVSKLDNAADAMKTNLDNIQASTDAIHASGPQMVAQLQQTLNNLDGIVSDVSQFTKALNSDQGTLGKFLHDPEVYDRLNRTAANMERLTQKLRPIVDDARIISDKIARHPGVILRDAVKPGPGTKGVPGQASRAYGRYPVEPAGARVPLLQRRSLY